MFEGLKKAFTQPSQPSSPEIKPKTIYILASEKGQSDPWGLKIATRVEVVEVKSGWVRYCFVDEKGKSTISIFDNQVKLVEDFLNIYAVDEDL